MQSLRLTIKTNVGTIFEQSNLSGSTMALEKEGVSGWSSFPSSLRSFSGHGIVGMACFSVIIGVINLDVIFSELVRKHSFHLGVHVRPSQR